MLLGSIIQEVGDSLQQTIDYSQWLDEGEILTGVSFTVDSGTATISNVTYSPNKLRVQFLLNGGTLGDSFNVIAIAQTSMGQQRTDTIGVCVETNGGPVF